MTSVSKRAILATGLPHTNGAKLDHPLDLPSNRDMDSGSPTSMRRRSDTFVPRCTPLPPAYIPEYDQSIHHLQELSCAAACLIP
jgi:hypothetical protein